MKTKVDVYGDSILKGVIYNSETGRYEVCTEKGVDALCAEYGIELFNRSKFGYTVSDGMNLFSRDVSRGALKGDYVLLEYGGNDSNFRWAEISENPDKKHDPNTALEQFTTTLSTMIEQVRAMGKTPLLMTLPPVDGDKYLDFLSRSYDREHILKWLGDANMIHRYQEMYSLAVMKLAYKTNTLLCDVRSAFLSRRNYKKLLCEDGLHPTPKGQALIINTFYRFLHARQKDPAGATV